MGVKAVNQASKGGDHSLACVEAPLPLAASVAHRMQPADGVAHNEQVGAYGLGVSEFGDRLFAGEGGSVN